MIPLDDVIASLQRAETRVLPGLEHATEELMLACEKKSKKMIGIEWSDWPPLAESTVREKERLGFTGHVSETDPLLRTGELRESIHSGAFIEGASAVGVVGSNSPYAQYQEMGTSRIPPRPFLAPPIATSELLALSLFERLAESLLTPGRIP